MSELCYRVISDLENHPSRLNKEQIIFEQAREGNSEFFEGARMAMDAMITFGVKKVPTHSGPDGQGLPWAVFFDLAEKLRKRELTGNDAKKAIDLCLTIATQREWNDWYRRILIKDLRCGVSEKTINKVVEDEWPEYSVPVFSCQLAHDSANHESKVTGSKLIEVKLDGVRVITVVYPDGRVDQYSRNGKELVNFPHVKAQFATVAKKFTEPMVFDGEIMSSSFQDLMKQIHRKSSAQAQDAVLYLFDMLTLAEFESGESATTQEKRSEALRTWFADKLFLQMINVQLVEQETVDLDTDAGQARYKEINLMAIDGGYEGIMIKDPKAPYECKRATSWLKLKPFIEVSLTVVAVEEGTGKNIGRLGALVCEGDDDGRRIVVNVGSGFSDDDRIAYWASREKVVGMVVEVRADAITQNQDGTYSLRFPRFLRFRGFVNGEKI
jgi:DNA ligase-1